MVKRKLNLSFFAVNCNQNSRSLKVHFKVILSLETFQPAF